jgi:hypothetical protein
MDKEEDAYVFIVTPAMYKRTIKKLPEYKLIVNDKKDMIINLDELDESCLENVEKAIINYNSVEHYLDSVFKRDITTKYKLKKKGVRRVDIEFEDEDEVEVVKEDKIKPTMILEEDEEVIEQPEQPEQNPVKLISPEEEIIVVKKRRTKKQREQKTQVNPPGKKGTRKIRRLPEDFEIVENVDML